MRKIKRRSLTPNPAACMIGFRRRSTISAVTIQYPLDSVRISSMLKRNKSEGKNCAESSVSAGERGQAESRGWWLSLNIPCGVIRSEATSQAE